MLIERLTAEELSMMDIYRKNNAWSEDSHNRTNDYAPMASILHEWDIQKSKYLHKLFGDSLMISKKIAYKKSYEELQDELSTMMQESTSFGRAGRNGSEFSYAYNDYLYRNRNLFTENQKDGLYRLMSDDCLISNVYDGNSFEIETPSGKLYRVNRNCKTIKALGKLANIFDLHGFEDFRICHSLILNQKELGGVLTLSIHPMDYMTMSDNAYDWESCMSWTREGGYRQGTVEMMNSKSVVVAYLAGDVDYDVGAGHVWNSKKWRQLFVVDHNIIAGVKDYPYHNADLGAEVVKWLKELAETNLGWKYGEVEKFAFEGKKIHLDYLPKEKNDFVIEFNTDNMYNDFGCLDFHWICMSTDINPNEIQSNNTELYSRTWLAVEYSGSSQCMICGELDPHLEDESCLACEECQDRQRCDCCGEVNGEVYEIDGMRLCSYCYENRVHECNSCGEEHYDEYMIPIYIIPRLDANRQKALCEEYIENHPYWSCGFCDSIEDLKQAEYNFFKDYTYAWVCDEHTECMEHWIEKYMKPGERPHRREMRWTTDVYVYYDQLNEDGQDEFTWGFDGNNELYANSFRLSRAEPTRFIELL